MTNTSTASGAVIPRYKIGYRSDEWGMRSSTPGGVSDPAGQWVRYDDHIAALASAAAPAQQPNTACAALPAECDSPELCAVSRSCAGQFGTKRICASRGQAPATNPWREAVVNACMPTEACFDGGNPTATIKNLIDWHLETAALREPAATPQADSQPAPANTRQIAECYGDCPEDPKTCRNQCKFEGRAARAPAESVTAPVGQPYGIVDPDYARVFTQARIIAWQYGYACVMHGSFTRDLDLLLVPWTEQAGDNHDQLLKLIAGSCGLRFLDGKEEVYESTVDFTEKPHGRKSCSLFFREFGDRRWIDISIVLRPLYATPPAQAADSVLEDAARYRHIRDVPHSEEVRSVLSLQQNAVMDKVIDKDRAAMAAKKGDSA